MCDIVRVPTNACLRLAPRLRFEQSVEKNLMLRLVPCLQNKWARVVVGSLGSGRLPAASMPTDGH